VKNTLLFEDDMTQARIPFIDKSFRMLADAAAFAKKVHVLWLGVGTAKPERFRDGIRQLHVGLTEANIQHFYVEFPGTDHEWETWRRAPKDFAPRLFRERKGL
jgi:enterochelin esterase-like enzyme